MANTQPPLEHPDSISSQDPNLQPEEKKKSRRPANTAFRQQRLKAWQPILTPKTVLPLFFIIGIIFAPIGGGLLYASAVVQEIILDYSRCHLDAPDWPIDNVEVPHYEMHFAENKSSTVKAKMPTWSRRRVPIKFGDRQMETWQCQLNFSIPNNMEPPVYFYYRLTNFYQNHRRYAKSFNTDQLSGKAVSASAIHGSDCTPLTTTTVDNVTKPYYPCGLAANSMFNDTFYSPTFLTPTDQNVPNTTYPMTQKGIAWSSDRELYGKSEYDLFKDVAVPPNWEDRYGKAYTPDNYPKLEDWEAFHVWMRLAGLPTFSKLAQKNENMTMQIGSYSVNVDHFFNVIDYGGTKAIIISTGTVMGGKNPFLGIAYVVVGGICIVLGALFTVTHLIKPRKLGDHTYLSWNNENTHANATTSGRDGVFGGERGG
ncbi:uncharacterized protein BP5553_05183 [Venustampulla echinocandica]|uniref:Uncharacterized protein n=1 Tax=Venustampulla echinocandica TaxID=2656787 RepID=A0A370TQG2_9HELO|nr:uncharacterized protein BP5553_05183 [Venustampulla echinocandica]RDL37750.1 hypothetical protein BP5553_05183 [Venustampulla echinocandica]